MLEKLADNSIAAQAADKLIAAHDGDVALLYIYTRRSGSLDLERAAHDLCRTRRELEAAEEKLRRMGLLEGSAEPAPLPAPLPEAEELPQYTAEEISRRARDDDRFRAILAEAERLMGVKLGGNDTRILFGVYDHLALPPEVIMELLHYCAELCAEKYEGRRRLTSRFVEKEAYTWANREILTMEQAEEYIRAQKDRRSELGRVKDAVGIRGRELSATEGRYLSAWLDLGFGEEAIAIAYDRTVTQTGRLNWKYMDSILQSWHSGGLHDPREIEEKDPARRGKKPAPVAAADKPIDLEELHRILDKI